MTDTNDFPSIQRMLDAASPADRLPEAVEGLSAAIERGHHMALVAGEGARLCRLYAAAAIHDLAGDEPGLGLVVVASPDRGRRLARSMERIGSSTGWETVLWSPERAAAGTPVSDRAVIIATPSRLLADIRAGNVSLSGLRFLALDNVATLEPEWAAVEGLLQADEGDVRRIAATHRRDDFYDGLVERLLPRARKWPAEMFPSDLDEKTPLKGPPLRYAVAASHDARLARLAEMLHEWASGSDVSGVSVWCDGPEPAAAIQAALAIEGFTTSIDSGSDGVTIRDLRTASDGAEPADAPRPGVVFGLPWTAAELVGALGEAKLRAAIVSPRQVPQIEILGARAGWPVRPLPDAARGHLGEIEAFRATIEEAIESRDLAGGALLIDPLIEKHGFDRVSAALATLFRETGVREEEPPATPPGKDERGSRPTGTSAPSRDADRATRSTWSRVFVNVGRQDGAAPGDFVGAITGETSAVGGQIGKIEIKQKFTLIDIDSMIVDEVLRGLNGKQIKSREVVAKLDRDG